MRRIEYDRYGAPSVMRLADFAPRAPRRGEVLVQVAAAAANAMDWKIRRGEMRIVTGRRFPRAIGQDFSGTVLEVGPGVTALAVGDAVFGTAGIAAGAFADAVIAKAKHVARKPDQVSFEQAATLPVVGLTALQALDEARIGAGHRVFINGALGGVGQATAQLAVHRGASVAGSVRAVPSAHAASLAIHPVVEFDFDPAELGRDFDLVFDTAGKLPSSSARRLVKPGGRVTDIVPTPAKLVRRLRHREYRLQMATMNVTDLDTLGRAAAAGALTIAIARTVPLEDSIAALTELEETGLPRSGKLVITP